MLFGSKVLRSTFIWSEQETQSQTGRLGFRKLIAPAGTEGRGSQVM